MEKSVQKIKITKEDDHEIAMREYVQMMKKSVAEFENEPPPVIERTISPPPKSWAEITRKNQKRHSRETNLQPRIQHKKVTFDELVPQVKKNHIIIAPPSGGKK